MPDAIAQLKQEITKVEKNLTAAERFIVNNRLWSEDLPEYGDTIALYQRQLNSLNNQMYHLLAQRGKKL